MIATFNLEEKVTDLSTVDTKTELSATTENILFSLERQDQTLPTTGTSVPQCNTEW